MPQTATETQNKPKARSLGRSFLRWISMGWISTISIALFLMIIQDVTVRFGGAFTLFVVGTIFLSTVYLVVEE